MSQEISIKTNGKLLLSGEYFVLDGALALAIPTQLGQSLQISPLASAKAVLQWQSKDIEDNIWFDGTFDLKDFKVLSANDSAIANRLSEVLTAVRVQRPDFLQSSNGIQATTQLEFPREWGLGSSSTLIAAVAKWAAVDPYALLRASFGGSGYDLACAVVDGPILFQLREGNAHFVDYPFQPPITEQLYFVFLGKKQNSREGIARYRAMAGSGRQVWIDRITRITTAFAQAKKLEELEKIMMVHEQLVSEVLQLEQVKDLYFSDYWGAVKSLGAWGGDFVLATSKRTEQETRAYFNQRGFNLVLKYNVLAKVK